MLRSLPARLTMILALIAGVLTLTPPSATVQADGQLVITGVIDGPLSGGVPKAVELYATGDIADLSVYSVNHYNNGGTSVTGTNALSGSASAGEFIYVSNESPGFTEFFGFSASVVGNMSINGDDVVTLETSEGVVDVFGVLGVDGTGEPWEYLDGWAYRNAEAGPSATFDPAQWTFSGTNALDGATTNATAATPFPVGTYVGATPVDGQLVITGVIDGPLPGGLPKSVELYATGDIADLSLYSVNHYNNGGTSVTGTNALSGSASAGEFIYVSNESPGFTEFFGFSASVVGNMSINGDDVVTVETSEGVVDVFGVLGVDGTGEPWEYLDGWACRPVSSGPSATFDLAEWAFSGTNALDGETTNATAATPFPIGGGDCPVDDGGDPPAVDLVVNEARFSAPSPADDTNNFIELVGPAGADLTGLSVLIVSGDFAPGQIDFAFPLSGTVPADGFLLLGQTGEYPDVDVDTGSSDFFSGPASVLVISGPVPPTGTDLDPTDSGSLDGITVLGGISLVDSDSSIDYTSDLVGPDGSFTPAHFFRCPDETGPFEIGDFSSTVEDTPGAANSCGGDEGGPAELVECATEPTLTLISTVQGPGATSPLATGSPVFTEGETVTIEGIVTVLSEGLDGFFVNEEDGDVDTDPMTSEGVYVYVPSLLGSISQGDTVQVTGAVTEDFGLTQIGSEGNGEVDTVAICATGGSVTPTPLPLPLAPADREPYESMYVSASDLVVSGTFDDYQFGELVTGYQGELPQVSDDADPGSPEALALAEANAAAELRLDDRDDDVVFGRSLWSSVDSRRTGDMVSATGALDWSFGRWKLQYDVLPTFTERGPDTLPALPGGTDVVSFNVLNYFNTFGNSDVLRGARSAEEFEIQSDKIVAAIAQMDAAVVGLVEIENDYEDEYDGDPTTIPSAQTLVDRLNAVVGDGTYDWIRIPESLLTGTGLGNGGLGTDAIAVGLIYQPERATPIGEATTFDIDADYGGDSENNRWPLAQTFDVDGEVFTAVVNHFKSKGSTCADTSSTGNPTFALGDDDGSTEAGNCDLTRQVAANALVDWLAGDPTGSGDADVLLLGDYNSYAEETPIDIIEAAGYTDLVDDQADDAFTYIFSGRVGRLDYAFSSPTLTPKILGTDVWQINSRAQYSDIYFRDPIDTTGPEGSSDHDPVLVALNGPPTVDAGGPYEVRVGNRTVELTAVGTDPDGDVLTYAWDLDGDGEFDDAEGSVAEFSSKRLRPGTYDVSVLVTDAAGETAIDDTTVEVVTPRRSLLRRVFEIIRWILTTVGGHR